MRNMNAKYIAKRMFIPLIYLGVPLITTCRKLEGYKFAVYTTNTCPLSKDLWAVRSKDLNCTEKNGYICIPNDKLTVLLEFCYTEPKVLIERGICLVLNERTSNVDDYNCSTFKDGCPHAIYWSYEIYKYPDCLLIDQGCFISEFWCSHERSKAYMTTDTPRATKNEENNIDPVTSTTADFISTSVCPDQRHDEVQIALLVIVIILQISSMCYNVFREKKCFPEKTSTQQQERELLLREDFVMFPKEIEKKEYFPWDLPMVERGLHENEFKDEGLNISLLIGNLATIKTDAFLISTNKDLEMRKGQASEDILQKAGNELAEECSRKKQEMINNKIVVTSAYDLDARWIIHISCPITIPTWIERLQEALETAENLKCSSLALPLIGTGNANINYGVKTMSRVILKSISRFKRVHGNATRLQKVQVVVLEDRFKELRDVFLEISGPQIQQNRR